MATLDLLTVTPHRLRFSLAGKAEGGTLTITNALLVSSAIEPFRTIVQQRVTSQDEARRLLLGVGAVGNAFRSPIDAIQPNRYCRVRVHMLRLFPFNVGEEFLQINADDDGSERAELLLGFQAIDAEWIIDLSVEHTLIR